MPGFKDIEFDVRINRGQIYQIVNALVEGGHLKAVRPAHRPIPFELTQ